MAASPSSSGPVFVFSAGAHCDSEPLLSLSRQLTIEMCLRGVVAVDASALRFSCTSYTEASISGAVAVYGLSSADLRQRSQYLQKSEIFCPIIDLSTFLFEESLFELFYAWRHYCLFGKPVVLPIVDAALLDIASALRSASSCHDGSTKGSALALQTTPDGLDALLPMGAHASGSDLQATEHAAEAPPAVPQTMPTLRSASSVDAVAIAETLRGTPAASEMLEILPWLFYSSFTLTSSAPVSEIIARLYNFAQSLMCDGDVPLAPQRTVLDSYLAAWSQRSSKRPNSAIVRVLSPLGAEGTNRLKTLRRMDVSNCVLGNNGCAALASILFQLPCLSDVLLDANNMWDEGCRAVCSAVAVHPSLENVSLRNNEITESGASAVFFLVEENRRIRHCDLDGNPLRSNVWKLRISKALERNSKISSAVRECKNRIQSYVAQRHVTSDAGGQMKVQQNALTVEMTATESASTDQVTVVTTTWRLQGPAAARAAAISASSSHQGAAGIFQDTTPTLEMQFDAHCPPAAEATWSSEHLAYCAAVSVLKHGSDSMLLNLARLNGDKLPVLWNGQRVDKGSSVDSTALRKSPASWADVAILLVCGSAEQRRSVVVNYAVLEASAPPPTQEIVLLLLMDCVINQQRHLFSTALRSLAMQPHDDSPAATSRPPPFLQVDLRLLCHPFSSRNTRSTSQNHLQAVASPSTGDSITALKQASDDTALFGEYFTETTFTVGLHSVAGSDSAMAPTSLSAPAPRGGSGRVSRPLASAAIATRIVGCSATQLYRMRINRCSGSPAKEVLGLLKLLLRNAQKDSLRDGAEDAEEVENLRSGEQDDRHVEAERSSEVTVRVVTKWGR